MSTRPIRKYCRPFASTESESCGASRFVQLPGCVGINRPVYRKESDGALRNRLVYQMHIVSRMSALPEEHEHSASVTARAALRIKTFWKLLGPGFIAGASDDDPSGIGTYVVAGASSGFATLWTALVTF